MSEPILEVYRSLLADDILSYIDSYQLPEQYPTIRPDRFPNLLSRWFINHPARCADCDVFFPITDGTPDEDLHEYLNYHGVPEDVRRELENGIIDLSRDSIQLINQFKEHIADVSQSVIMNQESDMTLLTPSFRPLLPIEEYPDLPHIPQVFYGMDHGVYITTELYNLLYDRVQPLDLHEFNVNLYSMLKRYDTLGGVNYHNSAPPAVMDVLYNLLDVRYQAFAHPIFNDDPDGYMSMYPDVDSYFNSLGTYRELLNIPGDDHLGVQAAPPFISGTISEFMDFIEEWFETADRPITVVLNIPTWRDAKIYRRIEKSPLVVQSFIIPKNEHVYRLAAQAFRDTRNPYLRLADSTIFVLQNDLAFSEQPIPSNLESQIRTAFRRPR